MKRIILAISALLAVAAEVHAQRIITHGATSQSVYIRIIDLADGSPETGVTSATSGLDLEYVRNGAAPVDITESDLAATDSAYASGGMKHVGGGRYRIDVPNAAFTSGVASVDVQGVCTDMIVIPTTVQLTAFDLQTATQGVNVTQFGGTNGTFSSGRPEVSTTHWGGTAVASANVRANLQQILGTTVTDTGAGSTFGDNLAANFSILLGSTRNDGVSSAGVADIGSIKTRTDRIPNVAAGSANGLLIAGSNAATTFATLTSTGAFTVNGVSDVAQTGDSFARIGSTGSGLTTLATQASVNTVDGILDNIFTGMELDGSVYRWTTNALEQAPTGGSAPTVGQIADAVWDEATSGHATAGTYGADVFTTSDSLVIDNTALDDMWSRWMNTATSDTGAGEAGRALHYLGSSFVSQGVFSTAAMANAAGGGGTEPDDRDLEPVQHVWQLKRSGDGTLRSTNPLYVVAGTAQTIRAGWNCDLPTILPPGTVISTESTPVLVTASDDVTITAIGHGEKVGKVELDIASDAVAGSHWVKTTITNTNGGGPIAVYGEVVIQAEPE